MALCPLRKVAAPLGVLADSVKKWTGVTVPPNMETGLSSLARGVEQWTLTALGAIGIEKSAAPLGILADSVKKWAGVVVPADMRTNLESLAADCPVMVLRIRRRLGSWYCPFWTSSLG